MDAKTELTSDSGAVKHAALTLYGYYCMRRNAKTGFCFPSLTTTSRDTGITPKSNVSQLKTFLKNIAWIEVFDNGMIRPLKGFFPDEYRFFTWLKNFIFERNSVLLARTLVLYDRTPVLLSRTLYKGSLNQPIEPAQLTREGTDSRNGNSAPAPADRKTMENQPAGKPAPRVPASQEKPAHAAPAGKPADDRRDQPAIQMVKEITGRFPNKDLWDVIIRDIRGKPNIEFFRKSWEIWLSVGGNPNNFEKWLLEPARTGFPPEIYAGKNGVSPPAETKPVVEKVVETDPAELEPPEPLTATGRENSLVMLRGMLRETSIAGLQNMAFSYTPEDWAWLMSELEKVESQILVEQES